MNRETDWQAVLAGHAPGDALELVFRSRGETRRVALHLAEDPRIEVVGFEEAGRELSDAMRTFRASWLGSRAER